MSQQPAAQPDPETDLSAGVPGPSGTGEQTDAGADPDAPSADSAPTDGPSDTSSGGAA